MTRVLGLGDRDPSATLALSVAFVLFLFGLMSVLGAIRRAGLPLADMAGALERVAERDYTTRVEVRGPREVRRLIGSFNRMVEQLSSADERRRKLLADVTHELRTPLTVIQGQLEGALDGVYPLDRDHIGAVLDETRHMSRLLEDLRTLSLAESGALGLQRQPTSLAEVVGDVADAYRAQADAAGIALSGDVPDNVPDVDADPTRVRQVLANLVSNALRYTPIGGRVSIDAGPAENGTVAVTVRDSGRGIPAEDLERIFDRSFRSADSRGAGLGLTIARDLVQAHGGTISAESEGEGRGTAVRFTLPVAGKS